MYSSINQDQNMSNVLSQSYCILSSKMNSSELQKKTWIYKMPNSSVRKYTEWKMIWYARAGEIKVKTFDLMSTFLDMKYKDNEKDK